MEKGTKSRWAGLLIGPTVVFFALSAIWKNETRFDYHQAAKETHAVTTPAEVIPGNNFSFTGPMDRGLTFSGEYVDAFTGYLMVQRSAEIYAWDRDEDSESVTWSKRWMSSLESNSRNSGIRQQLSSQRFIPPDYQVGQLAVTSQHIQLVDERQNISPGDLEVTRPDLQSQGNYLYLSKGRSDNIGDERVDYRGVPVPATATYFGKFDGELAVADTSEMRTGFVHEIIQDSGILHHILAGERNTALATMKAHIGRLKWIVRGAATLAVVIGFSIFFSTLLGFLYTIPIIGAIARSGAFILSLALGLPLALVTMISAYFVANPLMLAAIGGLILIGIFTLGQRKKATQKVVYHELENRYGPKLQGMDIKELEFMELAQLALSDARFGAQEQKFLRRWAHKEGWNDSRFEQMLEKAKQSRGEHPTQASTDEHLRNLVRLALADGSLSQSELNTIQRVARGMGYDRSKIARLTQEVQQLATRAAARTA